ncbi:MAG: lecithin retinol acyltransferase family protein [Endozoicomonas sp. (ex Botrylloides leachii)]|nr:lecithin retinol acyltransferase family protein [Endozoicomonas sp. (ex Botrylloides leachii)]
MKLNCITGIGTLGRFIHQCAKQIETTTQGLSSVANFITKYLFGSQPDNKKISERVIEPTCARPHLKKNDHLYLKDFDSESVSKKEYPNLKVGSIIAHKGAFGIADLEHHGVYLGNGRVMQFTGGQDARSMTGTIQVTTLSAFREQTKNDIIVRNDEELGHQKEDDIIARAEDELNKPKEQQIYDPVSNNCQHLASRIALEKNDSFQADSMMTTITQKTAQFVHEHAAPLVKKRIENRIVTNALTDVLSILAGHGVAGGISYLSNQVSTALYKRSCVAS